MKDRNTFSKAARMAAALTGLMVLVLPAPTPAADILVYSTTVPPSEYEYPANWFDNDLPVVLHNAGHTVTVTDRVLTPEITPELLIGFDQIWILSTDEDSVGHLSTSEIDAVLEFRSQGHGLLLAGGHTYPPQSQFYPSDANQIANILGVDFFGIVNHGVGGTDGPISPNIGNHPIGQEVVEILGHDTEALMDVSPDIEVVATYQGDILIAALDDGMGRVIFDVAFERLWDTEIYWADDNPRLVQNYALWLQDHPYSVPLLGPAGLSITCGLLGAIGIVLLRRRSSVD